MEFDLEELAEFLVKAKTRTYAGEGAEVPPEKVQRPGFEELEYSEGDWNYRDSYSGFFSAPGQEVVRYKGIPVWVMAYSGGMKPEYYGDHEFAEQTFTFLKKALLKVEKSRPFRGPSYFKEGDYEYFNESKGDVANFKGHEKILFRGKEVFSQDYFGGLILYK